MDETIKINGNLFTLNTKNTTYAFKVKEECGALEHLYYGAKIRLDNDDGIAEKRAFAPGNAINYEEGMNDFTLEDLGLEMSAYGKGDIGEPMIEIRNADGSNTLDFKFLEAKILDKKYELSGMPSSYDDANQAKTLEITLRDKENELKLLLYYSVFYECDVITRSAKLINEGKGTIIKHRIIK